MICGLVNKLKRSAKPLSLGLNTDHRQTGEGIMNTYGNPKKSILNKSIVIISILALVLTAVSTITVTESAYASEEGIVFKPESHDDYDYMTELYGSDVPVSKIYQALIQYNISSGGTKYKGSGECWGYANKVKSLFGGGGSTKYVRKKSTAKNLYRYLKNVKPGTHVRFGDSKTGSGRHSIVLYKVTKDRIYYSDANAGSFDNEIKHYNMTLDHFASSRSYILWYIQPKGSYKVSSTKIVTAAKDKDQQVVVACQPRSGASSYTVYRASSKKGKYTKLATVKSPIYVDKDPLLGKYNYYKIKPNNGSMSGCKRAIVKLAAPAKLTVKCTEEGYPKISWSKVKGAKKYVIYEVDYDEDDEFYKHPTYKKYKTFTGTSSTFKLKYGNNFAIKAIATNSKANSDYLEFDAWRHAPKPKIINGGLDENGTYVVNVRIPYDLSDFDYITVDLMRSDSKNGEYKTVGTAYAYSKSEVNNEDDYYYYNEYQYNKNTFDPETSVINITDEDCKAEATYYYKAVARADWSEGLDSEIVKLTVPERPVVEVNYGNGILYRYLGGDPIKYVYGGVTYTKNLRLTYWSELYYEDENGQGFVVDQSGCVWEASYDKENDQFEYGDPVGYNTYEEEYDDEF